MASKSIKVKFLISILMMTKSFFILVIGVLFFSSLAYSQGAIEIVPPELERGDLSKPGYAISFSAYLINTDNLNIPMKALVTLDGKLQTFLPIRVHINEDDVPEYKFQIPAPVANMSYQFVAYPDKKNTIFSERFYVSRACIMNSDSSENVSDGLTGEDLVAALSTRSDALDYEAGLYKHAANITNRLKKLINKTIEKLAKEKAQ